VAPAGIGESLLQGADAGEQQQAFAVGVEAAGGVDGGNGDELGQVPPAAAWFVGELAENPVGLVEQQGGGQGEISRGLQLALPFWRAFQRFTTPIEISRRPRSSESGGAIKGL
jgi:hypothetical protein